MILSLFGLTLCIIKRRSIKRKIREYFPEYNVELMLVDLEEVENSENFEDKENCDELILLDRNEKTSSYKRLDLNC